MLKAKGIEIPECSAVVVGDDVNMTNIIIKKGLFSEAEVVEIGKTCAEDSFEVLFAPYMNIDSAVYTSWGDISAKDYLLASRNKSRETLIDSLIYNVRPTHDDKPFFYSVLRCSGKGDSVFKNILTSFFPVALEAVKGETDGRAVPWLWSINSCANVVGALLFVPISQTIGFNLLLLVSGCLYVIALFFYFHIYRFLEFDNDEKDS